MRTGAYEAAGRGPRFAHAFAEISDGAPCKSPELRCLCLGLAIRLPGLELREPQA